MKESIVKEKIELWKISNILGVALLVILGLGFQVIIALYPNINTLIKSIIGNISGAMLIGGTWTIIAEYTTKKKYLEIIVDYAKNIDCESEKRSSSVIRTMSNKFDLIIKKESIATTQIKIGLKEIFEEADDYCFDEIIESSKALVVVVNDGKTWIYNNINKLENRFANKEKYTAFVLLRPLSKFIPIQAEKEGVDDFSMRNKILESIKVINSLKKHSSNVEIVGSLYYNTQSVFISENEAVITPYYLSKVRRVPPLYSYLNIGDNCYYKKIESDIQSLILESVPLGPDGKENAERHKQLLLEYEKAFT